jgi:hypothetical protein
MTKEISNTPQAVSGRAKRALRKEDDRCVNGTTTATHGCRCLRCYLVHKHSIKVARLMVEYQNAPVCNP